MSRVLLVDFDGVIARLPVDWATVREALGGIVGRRVESILALLEELWPGSLYWEASRLIELFELEALPRATLQPGAREGLSLASKRARRVYIASLQSEAAIRGFLEAWGLEGFVDGILSRDTCPDKTCMIMEAAALEAVAPASIVLLDDNPANAARASRAGAGFVRVSPEAGLTLLDAVEMLVE